MKYPYQHFADYLLYKKKDPEKFLFPLPIPNKQFLPKKWKHLKGLEKREDDYVKAYSFFFDKKMRNVMTIGLLSHQDSFVSFVNNISPVKITKDIVDIYKDIFFDLSSWGLDDYAWYISALNENEIYPDYNIWKLSLDGANREYLYKLINVKTNFIDYEDLLKTMAMEGYSKFMKGDPDSLNFGKFSLQCVKTLTKEFNAIESQNILEKISFKLKKISEIDDHAKPLPLEFDND